MPKKKAARPAEERIYRSPINDIVHANVRQIRQDLIDEHWFGVVEASLAASGVSLAPPSKRTRAERDVFNQALAYAVHSRTLDKDWKVGDQLPDTAHTRATFSQDTGIKPGRCRHLLDNHGPYTVEEMVAIAYVGRVDPTYMLSLTEENLTSGKPVALSHPFPDDTPSVSWQMWIAGLRNLAGQAATRYLELTSIPSINLGASPKGTSKRFIEQDHQYRRRLDSPVSGIAGIRPNRERSVKSFPIGLFRVDTTPMHPRSTATSIFSIKELAEMRASLRALINMTAARGTPEALLERFTRRTSFFLSRLEAFIGRFRDDGF